MYVNKVVLIIRPLNGCGKLREGRDQLITVPGHVVERHQGGEQKCEQEEGIDGHIKPEIRLSPSERLHEKVMSIDIIPNGLTVSHSDLADRNCTMCLRDVHCLSSRLAFV